MTAQNLIVKNLSGATGTLGTLKNDDSGFYLDSDYMKFGKTGITMQLYDKNGDWATFSLTAITGTKAYFNLNESDASYGIDLGAYTHYLKIGSGAAFLEGTWWGTSNNVIDSDQNLKKNIESLSDKYSLLFDDLKPIRFQYKNGTSGRYHTGFIAQELQQSIVNANLTEKDIAALCTCINNDGTERMGIRYEELIALCVNEI